MDGSHGKITEFLDYNELARHAPQRIIENHFPGLVPVNLGLKARGADYVREMFQRDFKAAMLLEDATDSVMPYFPGAWKWVIMPAKRVETSRTTVTSRIHTAFLSLGMHIIRDVAENGPTIENLGRYYAMSAMRDALSVAIDGGLERLRFEPTKRMKFDRYARVVRTGKPPRPGEEYDEEKA